MNREQAEHILDKFVSTHTGYDTAYYDAEFNIKMPLYPPEFFQWLDDLTKEQREYVHASEMDTLAWELECFTDFTLPKDKYPPMKCWQEGRQGGWLVCRWNAPDNGWEAIRLAHAINRIDRTIQTAKDYVSSVEFWQDHIEANCPTPFPALFAGIGL